MKYIKEYNRIDENYEVEEIEILKDIFQDIKDDGYNVIIRPNQRHVDGHIQYDISVKGSSNFADLTFYDKSHDMSKSFISNINRLESMGYEIIYRFMSNTLSNSVTHIECRVQFWSKRLKKI
jgi:hypothetical protein